MIRYICVHEIQVQIRLPATNINKRVYTSKYQKGMRGGEGFRLTFWLPEAIPAVSVFLMYGNQCLKNPQGGGWGSLQKILRREDGYNQ